MFPIVAGRPKTLFDRERMVPTYPQSVTYVGIVQCGVRKRLGNPTKSSISDDNRMASLPRPLQMDGLVASSITNGWPRCLVHYKWMASLPRPLQMDGLVASSTTNGWPRCLVHYKWMASLPRPLPTNGLVALSNTTEGN
jgi:hypothetical protein